jgi:hypothetical protein
MTQALNVDSSNVSLTQSAVKQHLRGQALQVHGHALTKRQILTFGPPGPLTDTTPTPWIYARHRRECRLKLYRYKVI